LSRRVHIVLLVLWFAEVCVVTIGSLLPASAIPFERLPGDKTLHFGGYFIAAALAPFAFERMRLTAVIAAGLVALGAALEFAQRSTFGRHFDVADIAANTLGVVSGFLLGCTLRAGVPALLRLVARIRATFNPL